MAEKSKKVLIAEDTKSYLLVLSADFAASGFDVITAENGEDGLALALKENFDMIVSDIAMPKMDGITMAKKIREADVASPIIFLTNLSDMEHISLAIEAAGNAEYVIKSDITSQGIVEKVKDRLKMK
jgi:DNA-binding response OmpR family regulator